ncbi:hypothetical protein Zmor_023088 [Zophobas morio]|uniref:Uncharacterized protein n=1 Tax=Zophobas morio TaxID=2755281 RepID=A0AA38HWJ4_9CUCU|nr:hypothetical protein Zmor_023088 [Zophobas morio]
MKTSTMRHRGPRQCSPECRCGAGDLDQCSPEDDDVEAAHANRKRCLASGRVGPFIGRVEMRGVHVPVGVSVMGLVLALPRTAPSRGY